MYEIFLGSFEHCYSFFFVLSSTICLKERRCNECAYMKNQWSFPPCVSRDRFRAVSHFVILLVLLNALNKFSLWTLWFFRFRYTRIPSFLGR